MNPVVHPGSPSVPWCRRLAAAALACAVAATALEGQGVTGAAIQGRVTGPGSAAIAGATVLVTNGSNGERWRTLTGSSGRYYLEPLSVGGPYIVEVRAIGFSPARREGLTLALGQRMTADFPLTAATLELQPITVWAASDSLRTTGRTGPAQSITDVTIARLPVPGRDFSQVARLSPQVVQRGNGGLSIAGQPERLNSLQIDGATNNDLLGSSGLGGIGTPGHNLGARTLSLEAIKELQIVSAPFDVRFGNFAAGLINAVTKSGTNELHGSASGYLSDRGLVGRDLEGSRGVDFQAHEWSATLSGPLRRDHVAFMLDAGIQRRTFPEDAPLIGTDTTGGADSVGVGIRYASAVRFAGILRNQYRVEPGGFGTYPFRVPAGNLFGKVTVQLGVNGRLEISHNYSHSRPSLVFSRRREDFGVYPLTSRVFELPVTTNATRVTWATGFGSRFTNELIVARMSEIFRCAAASRFPAIDVQADAGTLSAGSLCMPDIIRDDADRQSILELTDNLTLAAGTHRVTWGTHDELIRLSTLPLAFSLGTGWTFASLDALERGQPSEYHATLRDPARASGPLSSLRINQIGTYLQDQWSPAPGLTISPGLRLDVPFLARSPVLNPALRDQLGVDNTRTPSGHILWAPRLGINYDPAGDGVTLLRGGVGLFAGRPAYKWFAAVDAHTGREAFTLLCQGADVPRFTIDPRAQPTTCAGERTPIAPYVNTFDAGFRFPRNLKIAAGLDQRLPWGMLGTVDLLYTRAIDQYDLIDLNLEDPTGASGEGGRPMYGTIDSLGVVTAARRRPGFGPVIQVRNSRGNRAWSISAQLEKRFPNGTELVGSYTYGRSRDRFSADADNTDVDLSAELDGSLDHRRLAPSLWEVPHRLTLVATANLPLEFRVSVFYEGVSGTPFSYGIDGDANADGLGNDLLYVPTDARPGGDVNLVTLDAAGAAVPAPATEYAALERFIHGEHCLRDQRGRIMHRGSCRNPWQNNTNAKLSRVFHTVRGRDLELSVEAFNLLHLVDRDWGTVRGIESTALLTLVGYDRVRDRGMYLLHLPRHGVVDQDASRWRMQLGARYTF